MRLIYLIVGIAIVGAVVAPFYLKGPTGLPLMTVDQFVDDNTPEVLDAPTEVYRWQDSEGVWQFGDEPPATVQADLVEIRPNITPIKTDWVAQVEAKESAEAAKLEASKPKDTPKDMPNLGDVYGGQAIQQAKDAAAMVEQHNQQLEQIMKSTTRKGR